MGRYNITLVDMETNEAFEAINVDFITIHVANKLENGLYQTHSFLGTSDEEEAFRMLLSLSRAIQDHEFGHIHPRVGEICEETDLIKEIK